MCINRSMKQTLLAALVVLLSVGCSDSSSPAVSRDVHTTRCIGDVSASALSTFECDGVEFNVQLTQACIDQACGLIVDVHGWLSNPEQQEGRSNLARTAMDHGGYIVVQPGELSTPSSWDPEIHNDIVFEFMQQALEAFDVDLNRVHFSGFSQGGWMTWQFICDYPEIIASAAPLSAPEIGCFRSDGGPSRQVSVFYTSGTEDILIPYYSSGNSLSVSDTLVSVMYGYDMIATDAPDYDFSEQGSIVVDQFGKIDIASDNVQFEIVDGSEEGDFLWTRYTNEEGTVFEHLRHDNGHVYPDNPDSLIFEEPTVWFSMGEAILKFFVDNPMRG